MKYHIDKLWCINCKKIRDKDYFRTCHLCKKKLESLIVKRAYYCSNGCDDIFKLEGQNYNDNKRFCSECSEDKNVINRFIDNEIRLKEEKKIENKKRKEAKQEEYELSLKHDNEIKRLKDNINKLYDNNDELINNLHYFCDHCNLWFGYKDIYYHITNNNSHKNYVYTKILENLCCVDDSDKNEDDSDKNEDEDDD
jgi:uncharacterized membrane protein YheB (UPF0754 family)